ncbi:MAG: hypothetical protein EBX37_12130 [Alphaproteobacteria bacterium]|nr:hypothetical protein [Alphaproteobacteria bacterium]
MNDPVVIVSGRRTPIGGLQGVFRDVPAPYLGAHAIRAALESASIAAQDIEEVYMGCVLSAALGQAPARQSALFGGLPESTACTTVSKVCGSGLKAVMLAADAIAAGSANIVLAGGMESMSGAPHLLPRARDGYRIGPAPLLDHMFHDGLQDVYEKGKLMGQFAETCASIAIGFLVSLAINAVVMPAFGHHISLTDNLGMTAIFTVASIVRGYWVRRWFNRLGTRP